MSTGYEPNIEGAIAVLVDLMTANDFTMTRQPYEPNYRGLVDALIDFKEEFPSYIPPRVGFDAVTFEAVSAGDALHIRVSDGLVGLARMNGTVDEATVVGFANANALSGAGVKVIVAGLLTMPFALDPGDIYYLGENGDITITAPSLAGQFVTRVGEAATATELSIQIKTPILLT
jgi:hypothetical protein